MDNDSGYKFRLVLAIKELLDSDCVYMFRLDLAILAKWYQLCIYVPASVTHSVTY